MFDLRSFLSDTILNTVHCGISFRNYNSRLNRVKINFWTKERNPQGYFEINFENSIQSRLSPACIELKTMFIFHSTYIIYYNIYVCPSIYSKQKKALKKQIAIVVVDFPGAFVQTIYFLYLDIYFDMFWYYHCKNINAK